MQRNLHILLLLLVPFSLQAALYKSVDEDGNVTFSDKETPTSEKIPMRMPTSIPMPKPEPVTETTEETPTDTQYTVLEIIQPVDDGVVRANSGTVSISLKITPALDIEAGHSISVIIDNTRVSKGDQSLTMQLTNVDRGTHTVRVSIQNKNGKTLKTSKNITFHLQRKGLSRAPRMTVDPENPDVIVFNGPGPRAIDYQPGPIIYQPIAE